MILRLSGKRYDHLRRSLHMSEVLNNPYRILGLKAGASKKEVKTAYRDKVKTCHPGTENIYTIVNWFQLTFSRLISRRQIERG